MTVFSSNTDIPRPTNQWIDCEAVPVRINLPVHVVPQLEWLSERWSLNMATIAADVLVAVTSGRYVLAQLAAHHLQPQQGYRGSDVSVLNLQLLKPSLELLEKVAVPNVDDLGHKCGQLVLNHMQGVLNPQLVSVALPDPDGEKLRKDDESLTVHLPDQLERKIEALANFYELTKSDVMRNCLLLHVYGRIRYELWTADGSWRPKRKAAKEDIQAYQAGDALFSPGRPYYDDDEHDETIKPSPARRSEFIRQHGKSGDGARVFMPALLKDRLQSLAKDQGQKPSEYCRRTLAYLI